MGTFCLMLEYRREEQENKVAYQLLPDISREDNSGVFELVVKESDEA
jgi:hypothetical protein